MFAPLHHVKQRQAHVSGSEVQQLFDAVNINRTAEINYNEVGWAIAKWTHVLRVEAPA